MGLFIGHLATTLRTSVGTSLTSMMLEANPLVYWAGGLSCAVAPYAAYQQSKLTDINALKQTHEALKNQLDNLTAENERLKSCVASLEETAER